MKQISFDQHNRQFIINGNNQGITQYLLTEITNIHLESRDHFCFFFENKHETVSILKTKFHFFFETHFGKKNMVHEYNNNNNNENQNKHFEKSE